MVRSERHRQSIKVGHAIRYLTRVVRGEDEADNGRIAAAKILINKVIPDEVEMLKIEADMFRAQRDRAGNQMAKDISHADPHALLRVIEGEVSRQDEQANSTSPIEQES